MMKVIAISIFASLFRHCSASSSSSSINEESVATSAITNLLRINTNTGVAKVDLSPKKKKDEKSTTTTRTQSTADMTSRERITNYVTEEQQMFFIMRDVPMLYEDPTSDPMSLTYVTWFCTPTHAPDANGDGMYDSIVARAVSYLPSSMFKKQVSNGATGTGKYMSHGYTASWSTESNNYYDEYMVDFDDTTVWHWKGNAFNGYETSPPGGKGGVVIAGDGEWTFDTSHPLLQEIANEMGIEKLTADSCNDKYAEVWAANNDNVSPP